MGVRPRPRRVPRLEGEPILLTPDVDSQHPMVPLGRDVAGQLICYSPTNSTRQGRTFGDTGFGSTRRKPHPRC